MVFYCNGLLEVELLNQVGVCFWSLCEVEEDVIVWVFEYMCGNQSWVVEILGIFRKFFWECWW